MFIRSLMIASALAFAAGCVANDATDDQTSSVGQQTGGGFDCYNLASINVVQCVGAVAILPITVNIKDIDVLSNNQLSVLEDSLNYVSILDGNILDNNKILNDLELSVLEDFLNEFDIDVTKNDIDVCTSVLGLLLCH